MTRMPPVFRVPRPSRLIQSVHARFRSPDIQTDTVGDVLSRYGLRLLRPPRNLPLTRRSRNVVVHSSDGRKFLKRYRSEWQIPTIIYGHSVLIRLAELGFPSPRLIATPNGETIVCHNGESYALFDFVEGTDYSASYVPRPHWLRLVALAGRTLARFHRQLEGFTPKGRHHLGFASYAEGRQRDRAWYVDQLNQLRDEARGLTEPQVRVDANWLMQNTALMIEELYRLDELLSSAPFRRLVIHGDYAIHNLLFRRDGTVTTLDFELARLEWRLSDLVTSLARLRRPNGVIDFDGMRCFVAAYQAEFPIDADEWRYLPDLWRFRRIQRVVQAWKSFFDTGGERRHLLNAREAMVEAEWASRQRDQLLAVNPVHSSPRG